MTAALVPVVARPHPFRTGRTELELPAGLTLAQMLEVAQPDPLLRRHAVIFVDDWEAPVELWACCRPRPGRRVTICVRPAGGGGGGKSVLRIIAQIAVLAAAIAVPHMAALGGTMLAAGTVGGALLSAGIGVVGSLLVNALIPPPRPKLGRLGTSAESPTYFLQGARNQPRPFAPVPLVLGTTPPLGALTYTELVGDDQYLRLLVVWGHGPLKARSERILAEFEQAREALAQHSGDVVGRLHLSTPLSFGVRQIAPVLADLAERHPRLEIDVSFSDRLVDLIGDRFDAAVRTGMLRDSSLVARRIAPARSVVVASPDYLARRGRPHTPAELTAHECLIYTGGTSAEWQFRAGKRSISIRPSGRLRSDSGETTVQWAVAGLGIANAPSFLVSNGIESGVLEPLLLDYPTPEFGIYVVRPPGAKVPGKVRVLIDTLVERFGGEPFWDRCLMKADARKRRS